jgi:hypothetical protein
VRRWKQNRSRTLCVRVYRELAGCTEEVGEDGKGEALLAGARAVADAEEERLAPVSEGRVLRSSFSRLRDSAKEGLSLDLYRVQCAASWANPSGPLARR